MSHICQNLVICGEDKNELRSILENDPKWDVIISFFDPQLPQQMELHNQKTKWMDTHCKFYFQYSFIDIIREHESGPQHNHILGLKSIAKYCNYLREKQQQGLKILIHCWKGRCRSTAAAIILLTEWGVSFSDAYNHVRSIRSNALPNRRMLLLAGLIHRNLIKLRFFLTFPKEIQIDFITLKYKYYVHDLFMWKEKRNDDDSKYDYYEGYAHFDLKHITLDKIIEEWVKDLHVSTVGFLPCDQSLSSPNLVDAFASLQLIQKIIEQPM